MSDLNCPYCGEPLYADGDILYCKKHMIGYNLAEYKTFTNSEAPKYVLDSCELIFNILDGKVWMSYGPADLFDEEFKLENTIILTSASGVSTQRLPQVGDVFISHGKNISRYLKPELIMAIILNDSGNQLEFGEFDASNLHELLISELAYSRADMTLTEEQSRAITAYIADSAVLKACTLIKETPYSIESMDNSCVLMSFLYRGIKQMPNVYTSSQVLEFLRDSILDSANFCTEDNLKQRRSEIQYSEYVQHLSIPQAQGLLTTDFSPERELLEGNEWVFWRNDVIQNCSQLIKECTSDNTLVAASVVADLYRTAYTLWGTKCHLAKKYIAKAKSIVGNSDPTLLYITYWNILSERMEQKLLQ